MSMTSDEELRQRVKDAILRHSSMVGLGMTCPHCGQPKGGDWNSFWNTVSHPETWGKAIANEVSNPNSDLRAKVIPTVQKGIEIAKQVAPLIGLGAGRGRGRWSDEARMRAKERAKNPNSHASKVKAYMKKHPNATLGEASKMVSKK